MTKNILPCRIRIFNFFRQELSNWQYFLILALKLNLTLTTKHSRDADAWMVVLLSVLSNAMRAWIKIPVHKFLSKEYNVAIKQSCHVGLYTSWTWISVGRLLINEIN